MVEYDPAVNIQHHPTPNLQRFGVNPYGEPLFRIVFAPSVRHLVGGQWDSGMARYHWVKRYQAAQGWILEKWQPPDCTREVWESRVDPASNVPLLGPFPARGYYELAFEFNQGVDADSLDSVISWVQHKRTKTFQDCRDEIAAEYDAERKAVAAGRIDEIRDTLSYKLNAPLSYGRHGRGTKTVQDQRSAEELGLPVPQWKESRTAYRGIGISTSLGA